MGARLEIFAQYGDPEATEVVRPHHQALSRSVERNLGLNYFRTLEHVSIFLRVSGSIWKFKPEGPDRLRYNRTHKEITIDLVVPEEQWKGSDGRKLRAYVAQQTKCCFALLLARAKKEKEVTNEDALVADFAKVMKGFEQPDGGD
jgi:hypothetical protein